MPNGEIVNRLWLVYSISKDAVYCFCCTLFRTSLPNNSNRSGLVSEGIRDWKHLSEKLSEHERTPAHNQTITIWMELKMRISTLNTIDKQQLSQIEKEKNHWRDVLVRILAGIHYLAKHNDAFRGSSDVVYTEHNGKFLGYIETLAKFDPVIIEHVKRIKCKETHDHYLSHDIQDQLITLIANKIKNKIVAVIHNSKYYSIMMDCTPDISHKEQLSLIIRVVDMDTDNELSDPTIKEMFMGFININSTTGLQLTNVLLEKLKDNKIEINNCRGQGYDNGANMKGQYQGVQARIKNLNSRAYFTPCAAHNLNLLLGDLAKTSTKAVSFFGVVQRLYCLFSSSTSRWDILKKYCNLYTLKPLSETRWECRVNSVKALRFQLPSVIKALEEMANTTNDPKTRSEANSLVVNELNSYEFVLSLVIWYEILSEINVVSKSLQSINMHLDLSTNLLNGLLTFFEQYRTTGFDSAKITANTISEDLDIEIEF
ncbi:zinc finger MYM-type protein 1-like [Melanaphis sacchari]|uniref:zinc finger MYM-type protein 1-like n=1 Tax=Melanaphis sacchari TaxID=742174 RepID=UPI000DC13E89|nr:zinc finger MYM-type protein 1-like [Melanaphis sacchari]